MRLNDNKKLMRFFLIILGLLTISAGCVVPYDNSNSQQIIEPTITPCYYPITTNASPHINEKYNYSPSANLSSINRSLLPYIIPNTTMKNRTEKTLKFSDALIYDSNNQSAVIIQNIPYEIHISINDSVYYGAKDSSKNLINFPDISLDDNFNLSYNAMINDPNQNEMYSDIIRELRRYKEMNHFDDDEYLELIVRFVQSIPYDETNAHKYPIEIIYENSGVCDDKSKLLAGLLEREGYDVSLFIVSLRNPIGKYEKHMFVGVRSNGLLYNGTNYSLIDTTTTEFPYYRVKYHYIGTPDLGGIKPQIIIVKVGNGTKMYNKVEEISFIEEKTREIGNNINYKLNCPSNSSPSITTLTSISNLFGYVAPNRKNAIIWLNIHSDPQSIPDKIIFCNSSISTNQKICS